MKSDSIIEYFGSHNKTDNHNRCHLSSLFSKHCKLLASIFFCSDVTHTYKTHIFCAMTKKHNFASLVIVRSSAIRLCFIIIMLITVEIIVIAPQTHISPLILQIYLCAYSYLSNTQKNLYQRQKQRNRGNQLKTY